MNPCYFAAVVPWPFCPVSPCAGALWHPVPEHQLHPVGDVMHGHRGPVGQRITQTQWDTVTQWGKKSMTQWVKPNGLKCTHWDGEAVDL